MRPELGQHLEQFSEIAKSKTETQSPEELERLESELYDLVNRASRERFTRSVDQRKIYRLQEKKQIIMKQLRRDIANLDSPEARAEF